MKITTQHFEKMRAAIEPLDTEFHRSRYKAAGLSDTRYQWDILRHAGLMPFVCDELYKYLNDSHIDTALRNIVPTL